MCFYAANHRQNALPIGPEAPLARASNGNGVFVLSDASSLLIYLRLTSAVQFPTLARHATFNQVTR
ncbi:hypothetical protein PSAC2689_200073 [Paraburkholderia sacchari]